MSNLPQKLSQLRAVAEKADKQEWTARCIEKQILPNRYALYAGAPIPMFVDGPWSWTEARFDRVKNNAAYIAAMNPAQCLAILDALEMAVKAVGRWCCCSLNAKAEYTGTCGACEALAAIEKRME